MVLFRRERKGSKSQWTAQCKHVCSACCQPEKLLNSDSGEMERENSFECIFTPLYYYLASIWTVPYEKTRVPETVLKKSWNKNVSPKADTKCNLHMKVHLMRKCKKLIQSRGECGMPVLCQPSLHTLRGRECSFTDKYKGTASKTSCKIFRQRERPYFSTSLGSQPNLITWGIITLSRARFENKKDRHFQA